MRITIMVHNLTGGGAERVAALWGNGFAERGDKVKIVVTEIADCSYKTTEGVEIVYLKPFLPNKFITSILNRIGLSRKYYIYALNKFLHKERPDVFIGVLGSYAREIYPLTRDIKTCVIQTYHNSFELPETAPQKRRRDLESRFLKDNIIPVKTVLTQVDKDVIGDRLDNVYVLPNPLAFNTLASVPPKKKIIMACGRLDVWEVKGFDILINSWGRIAKDHLDWKLRIVGNGNKKSRRVLDVLVDKFGISEQVEFVGFRSDIINLYRESEIFVLSSRYEGFGMVLIEAMSQGCACVACDYKGRQNEIIQNENQGLLCQTDNIDALSFSLNRMIVDDSYRYLCQQNALQRSADFSIHNTIKNWDRIFLQNQNLCVNYSKDYA